MSKTPKAPETITLEFLRSSGEPIHLLDLGPDFLTSVGVDPHDASRPFRVAIERKQSKVGNAYYEYSQNSVPLPDGLSTYVRLEGAIVPMGKTRPSKNGFPTREGVAEIVVGGVVYKVIVYITEGKAPYFLRVVAHKKPDTTGNIAKAQAAPKGGTIL